MWFKNKLDLCCDVFLQTQDNMQYAAEKAARLQETLAQVAQNNPNMDSPTVKVNKVKEIGENDTK